jgi:hypothetical protein
MSRRPDIQTSITNAAPQQPHLSPLPPLYQPPTLRSILRTNTPLIIRPSSPYQIPKVSYVFQNVREANSWCVSPFFQNEELVKHMCSFLPRLCFYPKDTPGIRCAVFVFFQKLEQVDPCVFSWLAFLLQKRIT